jgi:hypothetical protein
MSIENERRYFKVLAGSPVLAAISEAETVKKTFTAAVDALRKEYPATEVWTGGASIVGLKFKTEQPPIGWRLLARGYCAPDKRIKAGREIAKKFAQLPRDVDAWVFSGILNRACKADLTYWGDGHVYLPSAEKRGDTWIIGVSKRCKDAPPKCRELKMSQLWAIRERDVAARKRKGGKVI